MTVEKVMVVIPFNCASYVIIDIPFTKNDLSESILKLCNNSIPQLACVRNNIIPYLGVAGDPTSEMADSCESLFLIKTGLKLSPGPIHI